MILKLSRVTCPWQVLLLLLSQCSSRPSEIRNKILPTVVVVLTVTLVIAVSSIYEIIGYNKILTICTFSTEYVVRPSAKVRFQSMTLTRTSQLFQEPVAVQHRRHSGYPYQTVSLLRLNFLPRQGVKLTCHARVLPPHTGNTVVFQIVTCIRSR